MARTSSSKKVTTKSNTKKSPAKKRNNGLKQKESAKAVAKPFYKKWWFWIIVVLALLLVISASSGSGEDGGENASREASSSDASDETRKVEVADLSVMTTEQIEAWGEENSVKVMFSRAYSDTVAKDGFIKQSPAAGESVNEGGIVKVVFSDGREPTTGEKNAVRKAESYLRSMAFSRSSLIGQLEYEGFTTDEATYAVDNITVDWNEQAAKKAASYLRSMSFSREGLIHQLEYEGFTPEQAAYGVSQNGY